MKEPSHEETIADLWRLFHAREWELAKRLFHDDFVAEWPQSRERFKGAENFVAMNEAYPGTFNIVVKNLRSAGNQVISEVLITPKGTTPEVFAVSFFELRDGKIYSAVEYWADRYDPPAWRSRWVECY